MSAAAVRRPQAVSSHDTDVLPRPRVFYLDDEEPNCVVAQFSLASACDMTVTTNPSDVLEAVRKGLVDVVVTDQRMPEMLGTELAARVALLAPGLPVIIVSAFSDVPAMQDVINARLPVKRWFCKPLQMPELAKACIHFAEESRHRGRGVLKVCERVIMALERGETALKDLIATRVGDEGEQHVP